MEKILFQIIGISALLAVPSSSLLMSLEYGKPNFKELAGKTSMLFRYSMAMFIIMPAIAVLFFFIGNNNNLWIGVMLVSLAPAAPLVVKSMEKLGGNKELGLAWFLVSIIYSVILTPLNVLVIEEVFSVNLELGFLEVLNKMLIFFLVPMLVGFLISAFAPGLSKPLARIFGPISKIASIVLILGLLIVAVPVIINKGILNSLLMLGFLSVALIVGLIFGLPEKREGPILSTSLVVRLPASAIVLAQINDKVQTHAPVIIMYLILGLVVMGIANKLIFKKTEK